MPVMSLIGTTHSNGPQRISSASSPSSYFVVSTIQSGRPAPIASTPIITPATMTPISSTRGTMSAAAYRHATTAHIRTINSQVSILDLKTTALLIAPP
jgi:hypothetical protein